MSASDDELAGVRDELYGLPLREFTATRDARASEARRAGERDLALSVKGLRKPSVAAWLGNMLVRERGEEIDRLIGLGADLRSSTDLDGEQIRKATKQKLDAVRALLRQARVIADRGEQPVSQGVLQELEATLDAAFSDPDSAQSLRQGCLTTALHYSGLGFDADANVPGSVRSAQAGPAKDNSKTTKAKHDFEQARGEVEQAASEVENARRAVKTAEADLERLRAALTAATRREAQALEKASRAQSRVDLLRKRRERT